MRAPGFFFVQEQGGGLRHILGQNLKGGEAYIMGIVVVRSPKCLRGLLRRIFGLKLDSRHTCLSRGISCHKAGAAGCRPNPKTRERTTPTELEFYLCTPVFY